MQKKLSGIELKYVVTYIKLEQKLFSKIKICGDPVLVSKSKEALESEEGTAPES